MRVRKFQKSAHICKADLLCAFEIVHKSVTTCQMIFHTWSIETVKVLIFSFSLIIAYDCVANIDIRISIGLYLGGRTRPSLLQETQLYISDVGERCLFANCEGGGGKLQVQTQWSEI